MLRLDVEFNTFISRSLYIGRFVQGNSKRLKPSHPVTLVVVLQIVVFALGHGNSPFIFRKRTINV